MQRLWCCLRGRSEPPEETREGNHLSPEQSTPGLALTNRSPEQLLDVLLNASRIADAQDWIYRCILKLDAAAALLQAFIRLYIVKEDGRFELLLGSVLDQATVLSGPTVERCEEDKEPGLISRLDSMEQAILIGQDIDPILFGFGTGAPGTVGYLSDMIAAVPLSCGTGCFGALLLIANNPSRPQPELYRSAEQNPQSGEVGHFNIDPAGFSSREPELRHLGMALSLALTPELPALRRIAASLTRLAGGSSLRELVAELCDTLSYHVQQRFLLEPAVRAALVAEADATNAFMLDVSSVPLPSCHQNHRILSPNLQQQQQQQPSITAGRSVSPPVLSTTPWDPLPLVPRSNLTSGCQVEAATRQPTMVRPSGGRSPLPLPRGEVLAAAVEGGFPADVTGGAPQPLRLSPSCVAAAFEAAGGSLVARPFQLSYSLLLRLQLQQPRICGIAVRDCVRLVQDVNQPSRDVCLVMGTTNTAPASDSVYQPGSLYGFKDTDVAGVMAQCQAYGALNSAGAGGAGGGGGGGGSTVLSLALVGCDAGDGVTLAFYVCFPHRLPGPLVEAVRDSCQRLLERVLLRIIGPKVTGDLAAELGALRRGTAGTFAIIQMPYSRMGSHLGPIGGVGAGPSSSPAATGGAGMGPGPLDGTGPVISSSTLGSDLPLGGNFATTSATTMTTTATTISIIPQLAAASTITGAGSAAGGGGSTTMTGAASGVANSLNPAQMKRQIRATSYAVTRGVLLQLENGGGGGSGAGGGALHGQESVRGIGTRAVIGGGGVGGAGSLSELLSHSSSTSASRSRSVTAVRQHHCTTGGHASGFGGSSVGMLSKVLGDRRKTLAGLSGLSTTHNMSDMVMLPSRLPILDASLGGGGGGGGGGGADSWVQIAGPHTGPTIDADAIPAFLSSSHFVSGSQLPVLGNPHEAIRRAASVIVVRDLDTEARGSCQQQLGALVSSIRESITIAAGPNPVTGAYLSPVDTAPVRPQGLIVSLGGGADGAVGGSEGGGAALGCSRPTMPGLYLGWEDNSLVAGCSGAAVAGGGSVFSIGRATAVGAPTSIAAAACGLDSEAADVADLRLVCKLGQGGCGSVFLGQMAGGLEVAVKLLELPSCFDIEHFVEQFSPGPGFMPRARGASGLNNTGGGVGSVGSCSSFGDVDLGVVLASEALRQQVRARRSLLQSATELAMLTSISHPNIVQVYGVYSNVVLETRTIVEGQVSYRLRQHLEVLQEEHMIESVEAAGAAPVYDRRRMLFSNVCSAVCMTLCDLGSLATALTERGFPNPMEASIPSPSATTIMSHGSGRTQPATSLSALGLQPQRSQDANSPAFGTSVLKNVRSVYLTLLEVALALRYLHGRNIIHRDLKPGNILLKSRTPTPGDPRGFTTKLADFGLALVLDREPLARPHSSQSLTTQQQQLHQQQQQLRGGGVGPPDSGSSSRDIFAAVPGRYTLQDQPCGTVDHMAPEACRGKGSRLTAAADVYSFGIVMLEVVTAGRRPYGNVPAERIARLVMAGARPLFPSWVPAQYRSLAEACWAADPAARPTAAQLVVAIRQQLHRYPAAAAAAAAAGATGSSGSHAGDNASTGVSARQFSPCIGPNSNSSINTNNINRTASCSAATTTATTITANTENQPYSQQQQ